MMKKGWHWIVFTLLIISTSFVSVGALLYFALTDKSFAIEPDYYQQALHYENTREQLRNNEMLAWHINYEIAPTTEPNQRSVTATLTDADGNPITGALIDILAFFNARSADRFSIPLSELADSPGDYTCWLPVAHPGYWEFRCAVRAGDEVFTDKRSITIYPADPLPPTPE